MVRCTRIGVLGILDGRCGEACRRGAHGVFAWVLAWLVWVTGAVLVKLASVVDGRDVKARVRPRHRIAGRIMASRTM